MRVVLALMAKDLRLLLRDKAGFFFTFGFPIAFAILFGSIFAGQGGGEDGQTARIPVVVVDEDGTADAETFSAALAGEESLAVDRAADRATAADLVRRGRRTAYVVIAEGYGQAGERMFWGDPARLEVGIDPSRSAEGAMLRGILTKHAFQRVQGMFGDPEVMRRQADTALAAVLGEDAMDPAARGPVTDFLRSLRRFADDLPEAGGDGAPAAGEGNPAAGWQPVEIDVVPVTGERRAGADPPSSFAISFPQATIWGVMGCAAAFGISLVVERTRGTLVRLRTAPVTLGQILLGKAAACFLMTALVATMLLLLAIVAFGVRPGWSATPKLALAVACVAFAFVGIMMVLSVLGKTEAAAGGIGWAVLIVMAMIGGGMIPLMVMPAWMQSAASISPVKWAITAMEGALWRGFGYGELLVPCGILVGVGVIGLAAGTAIFRVTARG